MNVLLPQAENFHFDTLSKLIPVQLEYTVGIEDIIAGNIDMLCWNERAQEFQIWDYKNLKEIEGLPPLQLQILKNQATYVKPGGTLLYSTCTLVRPENEGVVEQFLKENNEFYLEALDLPPVFPKNTDGMLALVPGEYDTDGFFIAKLRRKV